MIVLHNLSGQNQNASISVKDVGGGKMNDLFDSKGNIVLNMDVNWLSLSGHGFKWYHVKD
ncbi:MAG: hypothetical protein ACJ75B_08415 [Flavisolibacter sp.]